jgi:hypothetical protein
MKEPNTIPWYGGIPNELQRMLFDYMDMANHLLALGLYKKVGLETHYYPLAADDDSGEAKPIPADRELRDLAKPWFVEHYGGKYAVHYLDSVASFAIQQIKSWRSLGGDITAVPHLRKPMARLNNDLYTIKEMSPDGMIRLRITLAPHESLSLDIKVSHRHFAEWSQDRAGALVILPHGLRLCFTDDAPVKRSSRTVAYDFNFKRVVFARSDGEQREVNLTDVIAIQQCHRTKRESIQRNMAHNPTKAERLMAKTHARERNRVNDLLHKKIHGKDSEIGSFIEGHHLGVEDLSKTSKEVLKDDHGRKFNPKMSSWIHGRFRDIIVHHHPDAEPYYTRGSSRFCPFDDTGLTHPSWRESKCKTCERLYDRDWLESVVGLVRTLPPHHRKGQPWKTAGQVLPEIVLSRLQQQSTLPVTPTDVGMGSSLKALPSGMPPSLFAPNVPSAVQPTSDIGIGRRIDAMLGNRDDADEGSLNKLDTTQRLRKDTHRVCFYGVVNRYPLRRRRRRREGPELRGQSTGRGPTPAPGQWRGGTPPWPEDRSRGGRGVPRPT